MVRSGSGVREHDHSGRVRAVAGERRSIVFMPESAYGPTNNCIGIGKVLERRGHRVVFAAEASWKGKLEPLGVEGGPGARAPPGGGRRKRAPAPPGVGEGLGALAPPAEGEQDSGQFWIDFVAEPAPEFRKPT